MCSQKNPVIGVYSRTVVLVPLSLLSCCTWAHKYPMT
uniref:Uncharacterized protein n=1 Tax=Arundo donax TaxID=35708 RepID=A0A0A9AX34_ARUDO